MDFHFNYIRDEELFNKLAENFMGCEFNFGVNLETVTIPRAIFESYIEDSLLLERLEDAGVDNWLGYEEAYKEYDEMLENGTVNEIIDRFSIKR
jgi:hypothetical protein